MTALRTMGGNLYRRFAAPFGSRALDRHLDDGLPAILEPALRFLFTSRVSPDVLVLAKKIEARREEVAERNDRYRVANGNSGGEAIRWLEPAAPESDQPSIESRWLAYHASIPRRWGIFLHLCARELQSRSVLELGACVGISGAYLASAPAHPRFVTLDAAAALVPIAQETINQFSDRAVVIHSPFRSGIHRALELIIAEGQKLDLAYIDGHHDEAPTLHYVRTILPHLSHGALIVLDDIRLYAGMRRAWQHLSTMPGVATAVDTGRFGLLVWHGAAAKPRRYDLARYTGVWLSQKR